MPSNFQMEITWSKYATGYRPGDECWSHYDQEALEYAIKHNLWGGLPPARKPANPERRPDMQDPTTIIKELVDQLEHAHDVLTDLDFSGCDGVIHEESEALDRAAAIKSANAYLAAQRNADLFDAMDELLLAYFGAALAATVAAVDRDCPDNPYSPGDVE